MAQRGAARCAFSAGAAHGVTVRHGDYGARRGARALRDATHALYFCAACCRDATYHLPFTFAAIRRAHHLSCVSYFYAYSRVFCRSPSALFTAPSRAARRLCASAHTRAAAYLCTHACTSLPRLPFTAACRSALPLPAHTAAHAYIYLPSSSRTPSHAHIFHFIAPLAALRVLLRFCSSRFVAILHRHLRVALPR